MIGDYPTQLDEIDQWLNDNFGILPGACSSTESLRYSVARRVAEALWPNQSLSDANKRLEEIARKGLENAHTVDFSKQFENSMKILQKAKINLPSDVDEAAEIHFETMEVHEHENIFDDTHNKIFKAGAEWQKSQMISALKNDGELPIEFIDKFHEIDRNAFQNGQKNVKERLLKDAVEGVMIDSLRVQIMAPLNAVIQREGLKDGDKMKILIVKEEQK